MLQNEHQTRNPMRGQSERKFNKNPHITVIIHVGKIVIPDIQLPSENFPISSSTQSSGLKVNKNRGK